MPDYGTRPLDAGTWPDFAELVEAHNGVWGGCWCMAFHSEGVGRGKGPGQNRAEKEVRVRESRAHAALVYDGATCVGWCQFGVPDELPRVKNRRAYLDGLDDLPDWRITCFFADGRHRGQGVASAALAGALAEITSRVRADPSHRQVPLGGPQGPRASGGRCPSSRCELAWINGIDTGGPHPTHRHHVRATPPSPRPRRGSDSRL
jgi:hypothetical protein